MKEKKDYQSKVTIPANIKIKIKNNVIIFDGPLGVGKINIKKFDQKGNIALFFDKKKDVIKLVSPIKVVFNSFNSLIKNKIYGISQGFMVSLRIFGIGYRCFLKNNTLVFKVGFSHQVKYKVPTFIRVFLLQPTLFCIYGIDKNQITQIAAQLRNIKPPSPYKGKGIRFLQETVVIKQGKQK